MLFLRRYEKFICYIVGLDSENRHWPKGLSSAWIGRCDEAGLTHKERVGFFDLLIVDKPIYCYRTLEFKRSFFDLCLQGCIRADSLFAGRICGLLALVWRHCLFIWPVAVGEGASSTAFAGPGHEVATRSHAEAPGSD